MLNRLSDLVRLRAYANGALTSALRADLKSLNDLIAGDTVQGRVLALLDDGAYRVQVGPQTLTLRLPAHVKQGDTLHLSVVAREPQLKFALIPAIDQTQSDAELSATARFISALLGETEKLLQAGETSTIARSVGSSSVSGEVTPEALRHTLASSGVFYESHLVQWAQGKREMADLVEEPQARFPPLPAPHGATGEVEDPSASAIRAGKDPLPTLPELPVHRDALAIIKQQLDTLETRSIAWHGLIWGDQPVDWRVSEEEGGDSNTPDEIRWRTSLQLKLPHLGQVEATLTLGGRGIDVELRAAQRATAGTLNDRRNQLRDALLDAGIAPVSVKVEGRDRA